MPGPVGSDRVVDRPSRVALMWTVAWADQDPEGGEVEFLAAVLEAVEAVLPERMAVRVTVRTEWLVTDVVAPQTLSKAFETAVLVDELVAAALY